MFLLSGTRIIPGALSGIATTKNSKSKGNDAGGVGSNGLIFRHYRPVSAEGDSYLPGIRCVTVWHSKRRGGGAFCPVDSG
ncbi:hypothetical protein EGD75_25910 [Escherichia coli]|nr:hypothetical protein [Escherichia coli]EFO2105035.1 hypothetical protein [Escherichia coli O100]EFI9124349.1 hypothetical protein [Escherichia coli]EFN7674461.1 hypothetical protein [Escherichia coli]EFN8136482.1 hypothetical protein [Escherichia coli]